MSYRKVTRYLRKGVRNSYNIVKKNPVRYAVRAFRMAKYLHGIVNAELKAYDKYVTGQVADYNGNLTSLTDLTQGDTHSTRNGKSILLKYCQVRVTGALRGASVTNNITIYVLLDTQRTAGTNPVSADILDTTGGVNAPESYLYTDANKRFKVLGRRKMYLNSGGKQSVTVQFNIKNVNRHATWLENSNTVDQNHLWLLVISDGVPASGNEPIFNYISRVKYYDN